MILRRLILLSALIGGLVASAVAFVSLLIFTLHDVFAHWLGQAGGCALLFGLVATLIGAAALVARQLSRGKSRKPVTVAEDVPLIDVANRFADLVRRRPVAAVSAAVGAGVLAVRSPDRLALAVRRFAEELDPV